jgi:hypothetical protein
LEEKTVPFMSQRTLLSLRETMTCIMAFSIRNMVCSSLSWFLFTVLGLHCFFMEEAWVMRKAKLPDFTNTVIRRQQIPEILREKFVLVPLKSTFSCSEG